MFSKKTDIDSTLILIQHMQLNASFQGHSTIRSSLPLNKRILLTSYFSNWTLSYDQTVFFFQRVKYAQRTVSLHYLVSSNLLDKSIRHKQN